MSSSHKIGQSSVIQLSSRKLGSLKKLSIPGIKLSDGYDYILSEYAEPDTTLDEVRKRLSVIKTTLSDEIIKERSR